MVVCFGLTCLWHFASLVVRIGRSWPYGGVTESVDVVWGLLLVFLLGQSLGGWCSG